MRNFAASPTPARQRRRSRPPLSTLAATPALSALSAQTLRRSAALVAISQQAARLYRPFAPCHDLTVIPAGVDTAEFTPRSPESHGHVALEANSRPVQVMACGYLVRRKAFDVLIKAIAELTRSDIPVHLRLVGEGPARAELESLVRHLGIERHVTFAGLVPHHAIMYEYRRADVFCSTSLSESFSIVGLEALACGLPIVATPTGFFRELPPSRQVGALVRFGAVDELATALATLILTPSLRETMGHHARALAVQEYDWGVIARRYMAIYNRLTAPTV